LTAVQVEDKREREKILQSMKVQESEMVEKEAVEREQVKEGVEMVVEALVLGELNAQQPHP
jgi:hypothetical protein